MTLEQLQQFIVVAKMMNFSKAAESLFVSHSTISRNISNLEKSLGVSLLIRDSRSVSLTFAGQILYERGSVIMTLLEELDLDVRKTGSGKLGSLKICSVNIYDKRLFGAYRMFQKKHENINLTINNIPLEDIPKNVLHGHCDIGITYSFTLGSEGFEMVQIARDDFCIMVSDDHELAHCKELSASQLQGSRVITLNRLSNDFVEGIASQSGFSVFPGMDDYRADSFESLMLQIKAGIGFALLPRNIAREYKTGCALIDLKDADTHFDIVLFYRKDHQNPSLDLFMSELTAHLK